MKATPVVTPVTTPVVGSTVATAALPLFHVPPVVASASDVTEPGHTIVVPDIAGGTGFTVITAFPVIVSVQPVVVFVAVIMYVPVAVNKPKSRREPEPGTGRPTTPAPLNSW
jgi:hypothetical protein